MSLLTSKLFLMSTRMNYSLVKIWSTYHKLNSSICLWFHRKSVANTRTCWAWTQLLSVLAAWPAFSSLWASACSRRPCSTWHLKSHLLSGFGGGPAFPLMFSAGWNLLSKLCDPDAVERTVNFILAENEQVKLIVTLLQTFLKNLPGRVPFHEMTRNILPRERD